MALNGIRRVVDAALAWLALVVLLPLLTVVAFGIKLTSAGPVFSHQTCLGRDGRPVRTITFRTTAVGSDVRTPLGRMLRDSGIDKLPRLLSVALGEAGWSVVATAAAQTGAS